MFRYEEASPDMLNAVWDKNIAEHTGDEQWKHWKEEYISYNSNGSAKTFIVSYDGSPVGEETLLFSPQCSAVRGRLELANGNDTANLNALRIDKRFEGGGHISKLVKIMEKYAFDRGFRHITIGVEARETRNLSIYLHWGYNRFVTSCGEEGALVLYYQKDL